MKPKVLILAYYWPPSGGAGVQRWVKLSKYLSRLGAEVFVVTVDEQHASYMTLDPSLAAEVDPAVKVHKTASIEPLNWYARLAGKENVPTAGFANVKKRSFFQKLLAALRSNLFIPDPRRGWKPFALREASRLIREEGIGTVITSSPPHSVQLIGLALKKRFPLTWIADLRDPWTDIYYYPLLGHTALSRALDRRYERQVLEQADQVITVSEGLVELFTAKSPSLRPEKFHIVPNGFDDEDFEGFCDRQGEVFTLTYTGTMSDQYDPQALWEGIARLRAERPGIRLALATAGSLSGGVLAGIEAAGIADLHRHAPSVPHREVIRFYEEASVLLLLIPHVADAKGILTGKLFEYLAARKPVICLGPPEGDAAAILRECQAGATFDWQDQEGIYAWLSSTYDAWLQRSLPPSAEAALRRYARSAQARMIFELWK
jgi:glycosyltransferase involved in cell wall biosynthesis